LATTLSECGVVPSGDGAPSGCVRTSEPVHAPDSKATPMSEL